MVSVIPLNDEREHERATTCWCEPKVEWTNPETGMPYEIGPMVVHQAADCRQVVERLIREGVAPDKKWAIYRD